MRKVVLFGAGASHGSRHIFPFSPPLSRELFAQLCQHYPNTWGALPDPYPARFREDFERAMLAVMESGQHWISPLMQTMALFFTSFRPDGSQSDLYSLLLRRLAAANAHDQILFSTLNYECVFELAARTLGLQVSHDLAGTPAGSVVTWKLHGSCNFIPNPNEITMRRGASYAWGMTINVGLIPLEPAQAAQWINGDTALYPAMCMFTLNKPAQVSPGVFAQYQERWGERVKEALSVFAIGVRPHAPDKHIWDPLESTEAHVYFIGAREAFDAWSPVRGHGRTTFLGPRFETTVDQVAEALITRE